MDGIDRAIISLRDAAKGSSKGTFRIDSRCQVVITFVYLCFMLSVPLTHLEQLVWYAVYPIILSSVYGIGYGRIFSRSLIVLPFIIFIGVFNPCLDHDVAMQYGSLTITRGWVTFTSIIVRGLLSVQAVLLLVDTIGFVSMCRALGNLGLPSFLVTQLMLLYRYMIVLLEEIRTMQRARQARGIQRLTLKLWGTMIGQLFVRTIGRSERIHRAMLSRGFSGNMHMSQSEGAISTQDWVKMTVWIVIFIVIRTVNIPQLLHFQ